MVYKPSGPDAVGNWLFVSSFVAVIFTFGTVDPEGSVMRPVMVERYSCAWMETAKARRSSVRILCIFHQRGVREYDCTTNGFLTERHFDDRRCAIRLAVAPCGAKDPLLHARDRGRHQATGTTHRLDKLHTPRRIHHRYQPHQSVNPLRAHSGHAPHWFWKSGRARAGMPQQKRHL